MPVDALFKLHLRSQHLDWDATGHKYWRVDLVEQTIPGKDVALILCDMWDKHWCRGAVERINAMAPRMNAVVQAARAKGALIVHAPSDTMPFYEGTPARERILAVSVITPPPEMPHEDPPQPVDTSDPGSDTGETVRSKLRTRQHEAIEIDQERDIISDDGPAVYSYFRQRGIRQAFIMGVHTNRCVLHRSFGIKQFVRWGFPIGLVRDLTDALYNPSMPPYVSQAEGTRLIIEYIVKFWCPTIYSRDLLGGQGTLGERGPGLGRSMHGGGIDTQP